MKDLKRFLMDWIIPVAIAIILALAINKYLIFKIYVPTSSMYPTIKPKDRIMSSRVHNVNKLKRGDIVVFYSDELGETLVKRLIGLPGEKIEIKPDGAVYINNEKLDEPYVKNKDLRSGEFQVPKDSYFFLGDNRRDSRDSRYWKNPYIAKEKIMGKALFVIFPFDRIGGLK